MNKEIKEKWVTALLSGDYIQGKGKLKNFSNQFCCLGVLCDIHQKETEEGEWIMKYNQSSYKNAIEASIGLPPSFVLKWAGLSNTQIDGYTQTLDELNDNGATFKEIADIIEKQL